MDASASAARPLGLRRRRRRRRPLVRSPEASRIYNLTLDVHALRSEVERLEALRMARATRALVDRENLRAARLSAAAAALAVFVHGVRPQLWTAAADAFVRAAFDPSVTIGPSTRGHAALLRQWTLYSQLFSLGTFRVDALSVLSDDNGDGSCVIEATGSFDGRVTAEAVDAVFPHVDAGHTLVGRSFDCPTRTLLVLDAHGRVTSFGANADMLAVAAQIVGNAPDRIADLLGHARIDSSSLITPAAEDQSETKETPVVEHVRVNRQSVAFLLS